MLDALIQDVKYAARSLRHTPGFTAAAIVTLALGMGANATIFTLLDAVLFKPLPVSRPDELLTVHENAPDAAPNALPDTAGGTGRYLRFSYPRFQLLQDALGNKGTLAASTLSARFVGRTQGSNTTSPINTQLVSGDYFSTLGVAMQRGRALSTGDMQRDERSQVAVISDRYWNTALARAEQAVGRNHRSQGRPRHHRGHRGAGIRGYSHRLGGRPVGAADAADAARRRLQLQRVRERRPAKPWMDQDTIGWLNIIAVSIARRRPRRPRCCRTRMREACSVWPIRFSDARERSSTVARTLVVTSFARGFSGLRARFSDALLALGALVAVVCS